MPCGLQDPDSPTRDWTRTMAVKARSLNHWTTREFPGIIQDTRGRDTGSSSNVDMVGAVDSLNLKIKVIWTLCIPPSRRGYCTIILGELQGCGSEGDGRMDFAPSSPVVWSPFRDLQMLHCIKGLPQWFSSKELASNAGATGDVNSIPWRREWRPTPVFLLGGSHGQKSLHVTVHRVTKSQTRLKQLSIQAHCTKPTYERDWFPCFVWAGLWSPWHGLTQLSQDWQGT